MPNVGMRYAIRRTALPPTEAGISSEGLVIIIARIFRSKPSRDLENPAGEAEAAKQDHQPGTRRQPLIEKIADESSYRNRRYEGER